MKREELKKKIRENEEIIIKKLESNNIGSYTEYINAGVPFKECKLSYSDYLDYWLDNYCKSNLKYNTTASLHHLIWTSLTGIEEVLVYCLKVLNSDSAAAVASFQRGKKVTCPSSST